MSCVLSSPSLAGSSLRSRPPFGLKERSSEPSSRDLKTRRTLLSCIKRPGWEIRPLQCRFDSSECQQPSATCSLYLWEGTYLIISTLNACVVLNENVLKFFLVLLMRFLIEINILDDFTSRFLYVCLCLDNMYSLRTSASLLNGKKG